MIETMPEEWRDVVGFENFYEVSSLSRVRVKRTGRILSANSRRGFGYVKCDLYADGKRTQSSVHQVVCQAFHGPGNGREVNHIDGNKENNLPGNLEWATRSENERHGRYVLGNHTKPVVARNIATGETIAFATLVEAEKTLGLKRDMAGKCLRGANKQNKGWTFEHPAQPARNGESK